MRHPPGGLPANVGGEPPNSTRHHCRAQLNTNMNPAITRAALLLVGSNVFMTFAWYAHLRNLGTRPLLVAILASWGIAFFEYTLQVPANRIGYAVLSLGQLKILQEVITLCVFVPFAVLYMKQPIKLDFLWAGLCMVGAVFFVFRGA
jgi:hypothetical protein